MPTLDLSPAHLRMLLEIIERHVPGAQVWAYGSRVTGGAHEGSDLDLVIRNPERLEQPLANLARLRNALSESNLPLLVEVFDWARLPESFRREIELQHVVLMPAQAEAVDSAEQPRV
jgi:predicted nucleotidyltransferase